MFVYVFLTAKRASKRLSMKNSICMYICVYVCICMYLFKYDCIYLNVCAQIYLKYLTRPFFSVSGLFSWRRARGAWKLAGRGHDSCLWQEESSPSWAAIWWTGWRSPPSDWHNAPVLGRRFGGMECTDWKGQNPSMGWWIVAQDARFSGSLYLRPARDRYLLLRCCSVLQAVHLPQG